VERPEAGTGPLAVGFLAAIAPPRLSGGNRCRAENIMGRRKDAAIANIEERPRLYQSPNDLSVSVLAGWTE